MASNDATTRCVVLVPDRHADPIAPPLAVALAERLWHALPASDPLEALAELCLLDRRALVDRPWGGEVPGTIALVLVEPKTASQPDIESLLASITRYLPRVTVWSFVDGTLCRTDDQPAPGDAAEKTPASDNGASPERTGQSEITRQEIAMLLDAPDEEDEP